MPYKDPVKRHEMNKLYSEAFRDRHRERLRKYQREWKRKWRAANPERNKEIKKRYSDGHKAKIATANRRNYLRDISTPEGKARRRAASKKWKLAHPEQHKAIIKRWQDEHRDHVRTWWRKHSALRRHRVGNFTYEQWVARFKFYGERCAYCLKELTFRSATIDHIVPIIKGGTNWASNLAPACRTCNVRKNRNRLLPLWLRGNK